MERNKIIVKTKYGTFFNVPNPTWSELELYWPDIIASIIEVILENKYNISDVRKDNPNGFIAADYYWSAHKRRPNIYPLVEAKKFISSLKAKKRFADAIKHFNQGHNTNWLSEENLITLSTFIRSLCLPLITYLRSITN